MHRRVFITALTSALLSAPTAFAQSVSVVDQVIAQLKAQGYTRITLGRTFLGRTRIVAVNETMRREIIINPATGEILRDYWELDEGGRDTDHDDHNGGRSSSRDDDDDDRDDDDDHEDDSSDDDESDDDEDDHDSDHDESDDDDSDDDDD